MERTAKAHLFSVFTSTVLTLTVEVNKEQDNPTNALKRY